MRETVTMTLSDFLLARIAEDEEWGRFHGHETEAHQIPCPACRPHVLAECEAKRRIMAEHTEKRVGAIVAMPGETLESLRSRFDAREGRECARCFDAGSVVAPCLTLRALTLPYADHPDYREEWRP